jgi:hypothetical protein
VKADGIVTGLSIQIDRSDDSYCPSLVDVLVGDDPSDLKKFRTVKLNPKGLEKCPLFDDDTSLSHRIVQVNTRKRHIWIYNMAQLTTLIIHR